MTDIQRGKDEIETALQVLLDKFVPPHWHNHAHEVTRLRSAVAAREHAFVEKDEVGHQRIIELERENAALRARAEAAEAMVELMRGELKAVEDGTGLTNVVQQLESQIEVERQAREAAERRLHDLEYTAKTFPPGIQSACTCQVCDALRAGGTKL